MIWSSSSLHGTFWLYSAPGLEGFVKNTSVTERGSAGQHSLSTDFDEEMNKVARERVALRGGLAEIIAWHGLEKAFC